MKTIHLVLALLMHSGVFTQNTDKWGVIYQSPVCAVKGFSVSLPCYYYHPEGSQVTQMIWCSLNTNTQQRCHDPPYVYNSSSNNIMDYEYRGDNKSDCTLLIQNVQFNYSGTYKFRFITNLEGGKWTGEPGVILQVAELKVSLIRLSGNGTLKQGDSLNLTCEVNCTHSPSQFVWTQNNQPLTTSGPVLHFSALTVRDSGNYTCTWETNVTSGFETISLHVEGQQQEIWITAVVAAGVIFIILVILVAVIYKRRRKGNAPEDISRKVGEQTQVKQVPQAKEEVLQQEEVTYASVFVKDNKLNNGRVQSEQQNVDISVIYSTVAVK